MKAARRYSGRAVTSLPSITTEPSSTGQTPATALSMVRREKNAHRKISIALVGKYTQLHDAYLSVVESLNHAGTANDVVVSIRWVDSEDLTEKNVKDRLSGCSGILVPGGFGDRGIEGMSRKKQVIPALSALWG